MDKKHQNKILLILLITIASLAGFYFYSYKQLYQKHIELKNSLASTEQQLNDYQNIQKQVINYNSDIKELKYEEQLFSEQYPSDIFEEDVILLLNKILDTYGPIFDKRQGLEFSEVGPYNKAIPNLIGMKVNMGEFTFKNYAAFKDFMQKITLFQPKVAIGTSINIDRIVPENAKSAANDPKLTVRLSWSFLGYKDNSIHQNLFKFDSPDGNSDIFKPFKGMPTVNLPEQNNDNKVDDVLAAVKDENGAYSNYDFYTVLSPANGDIPSIVAGKSGDGTKSVFQDIDGIGDVEFRIEKRADGRYYFKYKTGKYNYPYDYSKMEEFTPIQKDKIILLVRGNDIIDSNDNVGAKINVYNSTDIPVDVVLTGNSRDHDKIKVTGQGKVDTLLEN